MSNDKTLWALLHFSQSAAIEEAEGVILDALKDRMPEEFKLKILGFPHERLDGRANPVVEYAKATITVVDEVDERKQGLDAQIDNVLAGQSTWKAFLGLGLGSRAEIAESLLRYHDAACDLVGQGVELEAVLSMILLKDCPFISRVEDDNLTPDELQEIIIRAEPWRGVFSDEDLAEAFHEGGSATSVVAGAVCSDVATLTKALVPGNLDSDALSLLVIRGWFTNEVCYELLESYDILYGATYYRMREEFGFPVIRSEVASRECFTLEGILKALAPACNNGRLIRVDLGVAESLVPVMTDLIAMLNDPALATDELDNILRSLVREILDDESGSTEALEIALAPVYEWHVTGDRLLVNVMTNRAGDLSKLPYLLREKRVQLGNLIREGKRSQEIWELIPEMPWSSVYDVVGIAHTWRTKETFEAEVWKVLKPFVTSPGAMDAFISMIDFEGSVKDFGRLLTRLSESSVV